LKIHGWLPIVQQRPSKPAVTAVTASILLLFKKYIYIAGSFGRKIDSFLKRFPNYVHCFRISLNAVT
jgi:hypothetical protein